MRERNTKLNKSRGLFKTKHGKICFSLWLLNFRKQDFIWIGLDWMAAIQYVGCCIYCIFIVLILFLVLVVRFELYSTQMPCIYARTHRLMSFIWLFNLIGCSVYQVFKYCINIKCRHQHTSGWFFIYNIQLNFVSSSHSSAQLDAIFDCVAVLQQ